MTSSSQKGSFFVPQVAIDDPNQTDLPLKYYSDLNCNQLLKMIKNYDNKKTLYRTNSGGWYRHWLVNLRGNSSRYALYIEY
ncbi:hypothetical protein VCRA2120E57_60110 [Vibrio crassostreae]|nr:hypothetical protein VCRA2120E57_60110 [Vibrio crassostreae]